MESQGGVSALLTPSKLRKRYASSKAVFFKLIFFIVGDYFGLSNAALAVPLPGRAVADMKGLVCLTIVALQKVV